MATAWSVVSGILASACCLGPLVLGVTGISGAAFAQRLSISLGLSLAVLRANGWAWSRGDPLRAYASIPGEH